MAVVWLGVHCWPFPMQQLAAFTPPLPTADDNEHVWLVYGIGLPTETPLLACTTAATANGMSDSRARPEGRGKKGLPHR